MFISQAICRLRQLPSQQKALALFNIYAPGSGAMVLGGLQNQKSKHNNDHKPVIIIVAYAKAFLLVVLFSQVIC